MPSADPGPSAARRLNRPRAASTALAAVFSLAAVFLLGLSGAGAARSGELPSRGEVNAIVEGLRADPDLKTTRRARILHFKQTEQKAPPPWWDQSRRWTAEAFAWLAATSRWLIWLLGALAVALILVSVRRWSKERADAEADPLPPLPSQVGILDVRPESLPDRIGSHARSLWQRGEQLACLSLLYRGALSRLIHVHCVPIRAAHTESECVRLAQGRLQQDPAAFFARLVSVWQLAVYAGRAPEADRVLSLCDQFDLLLGGSTAAKDAG